MRLPLDKLLEKLAVGHPLSAYETHPWLAYDEAKGITCSAEVRMGPSGEDIEAEIQFLFDSMPEDFKPGDETVLPDTDFPPKYGGMFSGGRQQILWLRAEAILANEWGMKFLRIRGKEYTNTFSDWDEKGCNFFTACTQAMMMGELPDIDALLEEHMKDDDFWGGGKRGKIGKKAPPIKPGQLLGMKK